MQNPSKVALVRCDSYDYEEVKTSLKRGLDLLGGAQQFVEPNEKILLKPNILSGDDPQKCIGPHPLLFKAIAELFQEQKAELSFGDSPGFGNPKGNARKAGFLDIAESLGIPFADFENAVSLKNPDGKLINKFEIAKGVKDSDGIISISKLKTHALTRITGAIKNQFGCIPGPRKAEFHSVLPNARQFSKMLVDLNLFLKPRLFIMDGIIAMEGNGPRNGTSKPMNVILLSPDPVALDSVVCKLIDLSVDLVYPIIIGQEFGLGEKDNVEIIGDPINEFIRKDFNVNRSTVPTTTDTSFLSTSFMRRFSAPRPTINPDLCTRCGTCVSACPADPKALSMKDGDKQSPPVYDYSNCIRCYCCQELCPESAIYVKTPFLGNIIHA